jgi:hypothetical protein
MRQPGLSASSGTATAVPTWPLDEDFASILEIDESDEYAPEIRTLLSERHPRGCEVLS